MIDVANRVTDEQVDRYAHTARPRLHGAGMHASVPVEHLYAMCEEIAYVRRRDIDHVRETPSGPEGADSKVRKPLTNKPCAWCGRLFSFRYLRAGVEPRFCSKACRLADRRKRGTGRGISAMLKSNSRRTIQNRWAKSTSRPEGTDS